MTNTKSIFSGRLAGVRQVNASLARTARIFCSIWLVLCLLASLLPVAAAQSELEPRQQTFIISAYYSPLPNQSYYFRGSYEADRRLNGNGTNGADGTEVYPGMLAAPKSYAFGTKLAIPGLGVGAVHDRGGAIVTAGERSNAYDRIDVWMGAGEVGLARALQWGMRTVTATVYPPGYAIAESFDLPGSGSVFSRDLALGDSGAEVTRLQTELKTYGYYRGELHGQFDAATREALISYQLARKIVTSATAGDAGVFAAKTRDSLESELARREQSLPKNLLATSVLQSGGAKPAAADSRFPATLSEGDTGERVRELQIALTQVGAYDCEINGIFDAATKACLTKFQTARGILTDEKAFGAGVFGPQTRTTLTQVLTEFESQLDKKIASQLPTQALTPSDSGAAVTQLQAGLARLGYYTGEPNGKYDSATLAAVTEFQLKEKIIGSKTEYGAGWFGARTKTVFASELRQTLLAMPELPTNPALERKVEVAYTPSFTTQLAPGDTGAKVRELQAALTQLGYYTGEPTGSYDDATTQAVIKFQLEAGVVQSAVEAGAGQLGPRTRAALNASIAREKVALTKLVEA